MITRNDILKMNISELKELSKKHHSVTTLRRLADEREDELVDYWWLEQCNFNNNKLLYEAKSELEILRGK